MIVPEYDFYLDGTTRRFQFLKGYGITQGMFNRNDTSFDNDTYIELLWRPIMGITDDSDVQDIGATDNGIFTAFRKRAPFIIEWNKWFHHLDKSFQLLFNDPVNSMDSAIGTIDVSSNDDVLITDLKDRIGNLRIGLNREIKHFGGTLTIDDIDDLNGSGIAEFPFFPPVQADFDKPEYFSLTTTKSGFKHYLRASNETSSPIEIRETKELSGHRTVIFDTSDSAFKSGVTTVNDNTYVELEDIETFLGTEYSNASWDILPSFLPSDKDYEVVSMPAQTIFRMDGTGGGFQFIQLDTDLVSANYKSKMYSENDGSWHVENNDGTMKMDFDLTNNKIIITAGATKVTVNKDGVVDIDAGSNTISIAGNVEITGSLDVA